MWPLIVATAMEVVGYILRLVVYPLREHRLNNRTILENIPFTVSQIRRWLGVFNTPQTDMQEPRLLSAKVNAL